MSTLHRRAWMKRTAASGVAALMPCRVTTSLASSRESAKLPVAAVITEYRNNSHADVIVGKILEGWSQDGGAGPGLKVVSMFTDQVPESDMSRDLQKEHGFRLVDSIEEAITLGSGKVQVAGVLSIGEHGNYPYTPDTRQHMYPRRRFFDEILAAFRNSGKVVPVFNDKHLGYKYSDALHMVRSAREMKVPLLAGSSLPLAWRFPQLELPRDCDIEDALAVGYGGMEAYGFHALETLQCMVERRRGGETGVKSVQAVKGEEIWRAERQGRWSRELLNEALKSIPGASVQDLESRLDKNTAFYLIQYRDGFKATVAMVNGVTNHFAFAAKLRGKKEPLATWFRLQDGKPYGHFAYLVDAIEQTIRTGRPVYPAERTLLTTGVLDAAMHSLAKKGQRLATPELDVRYAAADWPYANHPQARLALQVDS